MTTRSLLLLVAFLTKSLLLWAQNHDKLGFTLMEEMEKNTHHQVMIWLQEKASFPEYNPDWPKDKKAYYIFNRLSETANRSQLRLRNQLDEWRVDYRSYYIVNMISTRLSNQHILELAARNDVKKILSPSAMTVSNVTTESQVLSRRDPQALTWGLDLLGVDRVWAKGYQGSGIVIGGQDTGYDWGTPSIKRQYRGFDGNQVDHNYHWYDAVHAIDTINGRDTVIHPTNNPCGLNSAVPCDDHGHGTLTMGTILGQVPDEEFGVAPESQWIGCRCMERGWGIPQTYIECFQFFLAPTDVQGNNPKPELAPHVINNSWGCPPREGCNPSNYEIMEEAVNVLRMSGVVVVVSAGNDGDRCSSLANPAAIFTSSFSVGAISPNDSIARLSSRGPVLVDSSGRIKPDITAPGIAVKTMTRDTTFTFASGTSLAGPHVAGVVALMIEAKPELAGKVDVIEELIRRSAVKKYADNLCGDDTPDAVPNNTYGYGRIDALAAVELAEKYVVNTDVGLGDQSMTLHPNPSHGTVSIDLPGHMLPAKVSVLDAAGKMHHKFIVNNKIHQLDLPPMPGSYILLFQWDGGRIAHKLLRL